jgi:pyrophosphatase PpaX
LRQSRPHSKAATVNRWQNSLSLMTPDPPPYRAYLFDLDGVLVDTRDWVREAYRHTASRFGFPASDEALSELYGRPLAVCYDVLHAGGDREALLRCHREFQRRNMDLQRLFPGAAETLDILRGRGGQTALVSSRSGPSLRLTLERFDLGRLLDVMIWPEECREHKPHPEPVRNALRALGARPGEALVIGDTPNDILAGRAAGTDTAGATYGFIGEAVALSHPTYLISDIREVCDLARNAE